MKYTGPFSISNTATGYKIYDKNGQIVDPMDLLHLLNKEYNRPEEEVIWGECLYCGEAVRLPEKYCCLEHEEGRNM